MDNLEGKDKFLQKYILRLNQEKIEYLNRLTSRNKIKSVIKKLPIKRGPRPDGFTYVFYRIFKEELILSFSYYSIK